MSGNSERESERPVIGFDFDNCLLDTEKAKKSAGILNGATTNDWGATSATLVTEFKDNLDREKAYELLEGFHRHIYSDVHEYMPLIAEEIPDKFELAVVSRGSRPWQTRKIEESEVMEYFDSLYIVEGYKHETPKTRATDQNGDTVNLVAHIDDSYDEFRHMPDEVPNENRVLIRNPQGHEEVGYTASDFEELYNWFREKNW